MITAEIFIEGILLEIRENRKINGTRIRRIMTDRHGSEKSVKICFIR
jgi:hypothetical protein